MQRQPIVIVNFIIIMPPRLTYTAQTARTYFMRLSKAVEADYILRNREYQLH